MNWGDRYPDKLAQEQICEKHTARGILLISEVALVNSH